MKKLILLLLLASVHLTAPAQLITAILTVTNAGVFPETITVNGHVRTFTNTLSALNQIPQSIDAATTTSNLFLYYHIINEPGVTVGNYNPNTLEFTAQIYNGLSFSNSAGWSSWVFQTNYLAGTFYLRTPFTNVTDQAEKTIVETGLVGYLNDTNTTAMLSPRAAIFQPFQARATNFLAAAGNVALTNNPVNYYFLPANCLTNDGDSYTRSLGAVLQATNLWKRLQLFWNSNSILDTGAITNLGGPSGLSIECQVIRINPTNAAYNCFAVEMDNTGAPANFQTRNYVSVGLIPSVVFTNPIPCYVILTDGGGGSVAGDITILTDHTKIENSFGLY